MELFLGYIWMFIGIITLIIYNEIKNNKLRIIDKIVIIISGAIFGILVPVLWLTEIYLGDDECN